MDSLEQGLARGQALETVSIIGFWQIPQLGGPTRASADKHVTPADERLDSGTTRVPPCPLVHRVVGLSIPFLGNLGGTVFLLVLLDVWVPPRRADFWIFLVVVPLFAATLVFLGTTTGCGVASAPLGWVVVLDFA